MSFITPNVGMRGAIKCSAPFDTKVVDGAIYECIGIESISGMVASEQDPMVDIYQANGLLETNFDQDVNDGVKVIAFQSYDGELLKIPNRYLLGLPDPSGIVYSLTMLGIALSALPDTVDLGPLCTDMAELVKRRIGVESRVEVMTYGPQTLISPEDHAVLNTVRQNNMMSQASYLRQIETLQAQLSALQLKNASLEQYILQHLPPA
jgi:hypothetical protein